jgi:hypothetical protein
VRPAPPVARIVARAVRHSTLPVAALSDAPHPPITGVGAMAVGHQVDRHHVGLERDIGVAMAARISAAAATARGIVTCTMRRCEWPPSRVR